MCARIASGGHAFDCFVAQTEVGPVVAEIEVQGPVSAKWTREQFQPGAIVTIDGAPFTCRRTSEMFARGPILYMQVTLLPVSIKELTD